MRKIKINYLSENSINPIKQSWPNYDSLQFLHQSSSPQGYFHLYLRDDKWRIDDFQRYYITDLRDSICTQQYCILQIHFLPSLKFIIISQWGNLVVTTTTCFLFCIRGEWLLCQCDILFMIIYSRIDSATFEASFLYMLWYA